MVEAIEDLFIPVVVYNNKPVDAAILRQFGERSWNNPVVRFIDHNEKDLVPKREGVWTIADLSLRMVESLSKAKRSVPTYLRLIAESRNSKSSTATFAMHCYWEGEAQFGRLAGVQSTRSAWKAGKEVVEVVYDPNKILYTSLVEKAKEFKCASTVFAHDDQQFQAAKKLIPGRVALAKKAGRTTDAKGSDQKYYLRHSTMQFLPLMEIQSLRLNSALRFRKSQKELESFLSPRQRSLLKSINSLYKKDRSKFKGLIYPKSDSELIKYYDQLKKKVS